MEAAVIFTLPGLIPFTLPFWSTVATEGLLLLQVTFWLAPSGATTAFSLIFFPLATYFEPSTVTFLGATFLPLALASVMEKLSPSPLSPSRSTGRLTDPITSRAIRIRAVSFFIQVFIVGTS